MHLKRKYIFLTIWISLITYASLTPPGNVPKIDFFPHFDKVVHFGIYFVLSILTIPVVIKKKHYNKAYLLASIFSITTGIFFEWLQNYMAQGRTASLYDAIANMVGAIIGVLFYQLFIRNKWIEKIVFKSE